MFNFHQKSYREFVDGLEAVSVAGLVAVSASANAVVAKGLKIKYCYFCIKRLFKNCIYSVDCY